ncbi:MAG: cation:proton antiporter [Myxococcales bacterium]|nr:cation:proton antiporter [Myxococcales bacterium]MCB9641540.1 cation:proton antiporter [Myxococcales bacterium]
MVKGLLFLSQTNTSSFFSIDNLRFLLIVFCAFVVLSLAAKQIGDIFAKIGLPLITGFLFTGMLVGPFVLGLMTQPAVSKLKFIDDLSLAVIALAAGSELYLRELKQQFKSIAWITSAQFISIFGLGTVALVFLADWIPFMSRMQTGGKIAVAMMAASILVARSPSSAIAIINELRAKGPFTRTLLGVTILTDVGVIVLFAISFSVAKTLLEGRSFNSIALLILAGELLLAFGLGYLFSRLFQRLFALRLHRYITRVGIVLLGYGVFALDHQISRMSHIYLPFEIHLEPLLICMIAGFFITNYSRYRLDFVEKLHKIAPPIYVAFFTLTGASLGLDVLLKTWSIALILVLVRLVTIFLGSWAGGTLAGDPPKHNRLSWMVYLTQAGVGLGLAKQVSSAFPTWGTAFATMIISVIVVDQIAGPPLFKWAIHKIGEAHTRAETPTFDGIRDAVIFGLDGRTRALGRSLQRHGWKVKIATLKAQSHDEEPNDNIEVCYIPDLSLRSFQPLELEKAEAVVMMLSDDQNYQAAELVYEHFGIKTVVVLLHDRKNFERFHKIGTLIVDPDTAMISLFDHFVRSPLGTSFLLGLDERQDVLDLEVRDPALNGVFLRELTLPSDVLILSVTHKGKQLVSHGYTQLEVGDQVSVIGSPESIEKVSLLFEKV